MLVGSLFGGWIGSARADIGFAQVLAPDAGGPALQVDLWYPTASRASPQRLELFTQDVAPEAPVDGCCHPLVVFSHGNGGSPGGHYDTALALARAGFVVAAVMHTGDNYRDHSEELRLVDRPRHVKAVIDYMLMGWAGHAAIDPARIGLFGYSAGGFTALAAIGGKPDYTLIAPYCATHSETFVCALMRTHDVAAPRPEPASAWLADSRIKAAVIAAPALGFSFTQDGLRGITIPVQLWAAENDRILPVADNAAAVRDALPRPPEYHAVANADHFDFLAPCPPALASAVPIICAERPGFDRAAFHVTFDADIVAFLTRALAP